MVETRRVIAVSNMWMSVFFWFVFSFADFLWEPRAEAWKQPLEVLPAIIFLATVQLLFSKKVSWND